MPEKGSLVERPAPEIFRETASNGGSGVLRLSNGRNVRVVVFEEGRPVFGISNVPEDQLDVLLVRQRKLTSEQATMAKRLIQKEAELGAKLVELGMLDASVVESSRIDQVTRVIQSAMTMHEGEYLLDPSARVSHDISIDPPIRQWLLDTARSVSPEQARALLGPPGALFSAAEAVDIELSPLDSFLLSRITAPMGLDEIHELSGFPEEQSIPAVYALFASGLLVRSGGEVDDDGDGEEISIDEVRAGLDERIRSYARLDHYEALGVTRQATAADIKKAYYGLAKQYHPDRYHHASDPDVADKLEAVFAQVARAYETLKDERMRAEYDRRLGSGIPIPPPLAVSSPPPKVVTPPPPRPVAPPPATAPQAPRPKPAAEPPKPAAAPPRPAAEPPRPPPATPPKPVEAPPPPAAEPGDVGRRAEQNFQEGMRRLNQHDVMGAIGVFREAIRLAPEKGIYHFHLGSLLAANPRWHKEAEKHLLEAGRSDPLNREIFLKLGSIYQEAGLTKRAEAQYRTVLGLDPSNRIARKGLADMGCDVPSAGKGSGDGGGMFSKFFKKK